ncbi:hypothetical protein AAT19DRAFT_14721 [Rhodotorula toruloides]|uniref:Mei2-like C-terminal RNA recognition motif domain-containing protein n=1 Tax=Rhodotorula toruloides TaxID=5286 RepID=A0A2T0A8M6_RHOTO|nr:hypothetical protein AAT19DRAFT_14721 [Rhodotorula toruloides]
MRLLERLQRRLQVADRPSRRRIPLTSVARADGFVNFTSTTALLQFAKARLGTRWNKCGSDKLCVMSYANIQGKASLIAHFKNSSVLDQDESRRPKLFVSSGPRTGEPEAFPACDDPVRKARSAMNASNVGLFPSHKPVFKVAKAFKGLQISDES